VFFNFQLWVVLGGGGLQPGSPLLSAPLGLQIRFTHHKTLFFTRPSFAGEIENNMQCSIEYPSTDISSFPFVRANAVVKVIFILGTEYS
jgi:hypothetical protein